MIYEKIKDNPQTEWMLKDTSIAINLIHFFAKKGDIAQCHRIFAAISEVERPGHLGLLHWGFVMWIQGEIR